MSRARDIANFNASLFADDEISGDKVSGGTISNFSSTGIDDNASSTALTIDANERLLVGTSSVINNLRDIQTTVNRTSQAEFVGNVSSSASTACISYSNNTSGYYAPHIWLAKSNSATIGSNALVNYNEDLGAINFAGNDGTSFLNAASIMSEVDGTPGSNDMPGRLIFSTTADNAFSPTERMRIDSVGRVTMPYQPAFYAYNNSTQTGSAGTKMLFQVASDNIGGHYSTSNSRFTAPIAGTYLFTFTATFDSNGVRVAEMGFRVNGSDMNRSSCASNNWNSGNEHPGASANMVKYLSQFDYVEVYFMTHFDGTISLRGGTGGFTGTLLS